jgi:hypothetical protein
MKKIALRLIQIWQRLVNLAAISQRSKGYNLLTATTLIGLSILTSILWPMARPLRQGDAKAEIKKAHRDARYSDPLMKHNPISLIDDGGVRRGWVHIVDMDGYDDPNITSAAKAAIQNKIAGEQAAKRKAVICDATAIVLGEIKESTGYITTDDTAIYTVHQFIVSEVYRNPIKLPLEAGDIIEVTIKGGFAKTADGKQVAVEDVYYPFLAKHLNHILALKYDAEADDYYVLDPVGMYKIMPDNRIVRADSRQEPLARRSQIAGEPSTFDAITTELKSTTCSR